MPPEPTPRQVHDLRTNSRRLEAMLEAIGPDQNGRKVRKQVAKLRKRAGKVRDMDVLTAYAAELPQTNEEDCSVRLLEHLGAVRRAKAKKLSKAAEESTAELRRRLKRSSIQLQKRVTRRNADGSEISSHISSAALRLLSELEQPVTLKKSNLHPYRLKVKELHNLLRLAKDGSKQEFVESLDEVKDAIGEWHDWVQLRAIAEKVLQHAPCRLMHELKKRTEERYQRALRLAEGMRRKYLGAANRKPGRKPRRPRPGESVWSATSALAAA